MIARYRFILFHLLLVATWLFLTLRSSLAVPAARPLVEFPVAFQGWRMVAQERFDAEVMSVLKPTDYLSRRYEAANGGKVTLYIGYHDGGPRSGEIHSPRHCLPGAGWQQLSTSRTVLGQPHGAIHLARAVYQKGQSKELFFYWFQVRGESIADEYRLKLASITGALAHGRKDASFIRVSVPFEADEQEAAATGVSFIRELYPLLREFIPS
jgi:EpsI family protein